MRHQLKTTVIAVLLGTTAMTAFSQDLPQALPQSLRDAMRKAVQTNPEVQARWQAFLAADAERSAASGGYRPRVDLAASVGPERRNTPPVNFGTYNYGGASISLTQMLFDGGLTRNEVSRAGYAKLVRYYELLDITESTTLESLRVYADVLRYRELVELAKTNYVLHRQVSEQLKERAAGGIGRKVDAEQAIGRLALADSNLNIELGNLHDVTARYLRIIGEAPAKTLTSLPENLSLKGMPASLPKALETTYLNNPSMNAAVENVEAQRAQLESRKSPFLPKFELQLKQGYDRNLNGLGGNYSDSSAQIVMSYNLYRGGSDEALKLQSLRNVDQALDLKEKVCRDTRQTTMISFNEVRRTQQQLAYLAQHRSSTDKSRQAYRQQFDIGQRTLLDLLDTQNEYFEASRAYVNARYNLLIAEGRTMASLGGLMQASAVTRPDLPSPQDAGQANQRDLTGICAGPGDFEIVVDREQLMADAPRLQPVPVAEPAAPKAVVNKVTFSADAFFDFDKSALTPAGQASLGEFAKKTMAEGRDKEVMIAVGHTDAIGSAEYNLRLSLARASAVQVFLISQGLDARLIKAEGRGKAEPIADNSSKEGRAKNRRVEIHFSK